MATPRNLKRAPGRPRKVVQASVCLRIVTPVAVVRELDHRAAALQQRSATVINRYDIARAVLAEWARGQYTARRTAQRRATH